MRRISLCRIDKEIHCARGKTKFDKKIEELVGWQAVDELSIQKIGEKLSDCEVEGRLPNDQTLKKLEVCTVLDGAKEVGCVWNEISVIHPISHIDQFIATDKAGYQAIKSKLNSCGETNSL